MQQQSLDLTAFVLFSSIYAPASLQTSNPSAQVVLSCGNLLTFQDSAQIRVNLAPCASALDAAHISLGTGATRQANTMLYVKKVAAVVDASPFANPIAAMDKASALMEGNTVIQFRVDLLSQLLKLDFPYNSYAVAPSTPDGPYTLSYNILPSAISLRMAGVGNPYTFTSFASANFTMGSTGLGKGSSDDVGFTLYLGLSGTDFNAIETYFPFPTASKFRLTVTSFALVDPNVFHLSSGFNDVCAQFVKDTVPPAMTWYDLDLNAGKLTIMFSKVVNIQSVALARIQLMNHAIRPNYTVNLNQSIILTTQLASQTLVLDLVGPNVFPRVKDNIYLTKSIGYAVASTYLKVYGGFVADISGNVMTNVTQYGVQVRRSLPALPARCSSHIPLCLTDAPHLPLTGPHAHTGHRQAPIEDVEPRHELRRPADDGVQQGDQRRSDHRHGDHNRVHPAHRNIAAVHADREIHRVVRIIRRRCSHFIVLRRLHRHLQTGPEPRHIRA